MLSRLLFRAGSARLFGGGLADLTFNAIREDRFYIFPHTQMLQSVQRRMQAILQQDKPVDPFAFRPAVYQGLKDDLSLCGPPARVEKLAQGAI